MNLCAKLFCMSYLITMPLIISSSTTITSTQGQSFVQYISAAQIQARIQEMGAQISTDYAEKTPVLICVLKGAFIFTADLMRSLSIDCEVDFIQISSYGDEQQSSGRIQLIRNLSNSITDRDIIIVEDIVDSGLSMNYLYKHLSAQNPRSIRIATLLQKNIPNILTLPIDYVGFSIPKEFVIGYGLDLAGNYRHLSAIYRAENMGN